MCTALVILGKTCRNWMDFGLVSSSVVEEIAALMAAASFLEVSALRMLRMNLAAWEAHDIMQCWSWIVLSYNELYMMNWRNVDDVHRYIVFEQLIRNFIANRFRQGRLYVFLWDILPWTIASWHQCCNSVGLQGSQSQSQQAGVSMFPWGLPQ